MSDKRSWREFKAFGNPEWKPPACSLVGHGRGWSEEHNRRADRTLDLCSGGYPHLYSILARSTQEAFRIYHELQGWEPWKSMVNEGGLLKAEELFADEIESNP